MRLGGNILAFHEDKNGQAWVGTLSKGLYIFDTNEGFRFIRQYRSVASDGHSLTSDSLTFIYEDKTGAIWVGTFNGLNRIYPAQYEGAKARVEHFYHHVNKPNSPSHNSIYGMREDETGLFWIRTAEGINTYNRKTGQFKVWGHPRMDAYSFQTLFQAHTLLIDKAGSIWFSGPAGGVARFSFHQNKFEYLTHDPENENSLNDNGVSNFLQDSSGVLWVATWHEGLNKRVPGKNGQDATWYHYRHDPNDPTSISSNNIRTIFRDSQGVLWIATDGGGLNKLIDTGNGKTRFENFQPNADKRDRLDIICEDTEGNLWVGGNDLFLFDRETESFFRYAADMAKPDSLPVRNISGMETDPSGATWIGSWGYGLMKITPPYTRKGNYISGNTQFYKNDENLPKDLVDWPITSIKVPGVQTETLLWIGTQGGGLYQLQKASDRAGNSYEHFTNYTVRDGLSYYNIYGIEEDAYGKLWISTEDGLSKFDPDTKVFTNYYEEDGLPGHGFGWLSHYTNPEGKLYFLLDGILSFYPDSVHSNTLVPPVYITGLSINNKALSVVENSALSTNLLLTKEIDLSHDQNVITLEFAALNYIRSEENRYRYKLEGVDEDWVDAGTEHTASYQGLQPGSYIFRVRGSNNDGVWNTEGAQLIIHIHPPWWRTLPAIIAYILILILLLYGFIKVREKKLVLDKKILEQKIFERTEELHEANTQLEEHHEELEQQKEELQQTLNFLKETQAQLVQTEKLASVGQLTAGIAHEINNPVNYISAGIGSLEVNLNEIREILDLYNEISPENVVEKLKQIEEVKLRLDYKELIGEIKDLIKSIKAGSERTTEIVKGLRTFSRLDENEIKAADLHEGIDLTLVMLHNKYKHHVEIIKQYGELPRVDCFPGKLNQVFMNILSNAIDAIGEKGSIVIKTWQDKPNKKVFISIKDDGIGMSEKDMSNIFNPFFSTKEVGKGTGLGLSISHGIIEQHKGSIEVKSKPGQGAEFIISLPVKQD